ncbi:TetR/AcrR family transcriptional regulator [Acrocarpospora sp. B8E8]|uniref:TetR/AcrR family transcriptional regulator n=1 Tax=Acrocarpospora sp. B8E8 TaxID=3153572 RepID=UPI00325ED5C1
MRQTKTDRRSLRTRRTLMRAMVDLMRVKRYDVITVQEITDHANVGRSTFYAHFTDKDDLLVDGVHRMIETLDTSTTANPDGRGTWPYPSLALLHHIGAQADLYQVMARGRALALFLGALHDKLTSKFAERLAARVPPGATPAVPVPLLAAMTTSMLIAAIRSWIEDGLAEPAESIDHAFHIAADATIRAGLRS